MQDNIHVEMYVKEDAKNFNLIAEVYNLYIDDFSEFVFQLKHITIEDRETFPLLSKYSGRQIGQANAIVHSDGVTFNFNYLSESSDSQKMVYHTFSVQCPVYAYDRSKDKKVYLNKYRYKVHDGPAPQGSVNGSVVIRDKSDSNVGQTQVNAGQGQHYSGQAGNATPSVPDDTQYDEDYYPGYSGPQPDVETASDYTTADNYTAQDQYEAERIREVKERAMRFGKMRESYLNSGTDQSYVEPTEEPDPESYSID